MNRTIQPPPRADESGARQLRLPEDARQPLVLQGDCITKLGHIPSLSIDAVVTDPPYGLANTTPAKVLDALGRWLAGERGYVPAGRGFMGNEWDRFVPPPAAWDECFRVMKPGAHMVVFAGSRTQDLMGLSIRMAGFEIKESLAWARGGGMPKTADLGKSLAKKGHPDAERWTDWSSGMKPALEPIILARKPLDGTLEHNVLTHGVGALNIGATRVPHRSDADLEESSKKNRHADFGTDPGRNEVFGDYSMIASKNYDGTGGRWTPNLILDTHQAAAVDEQSGVTVSRKGKPRSGAIGSGWRSTYAGAEYDDIGGASRFFHVIDQRLDELPSRLIYAGRAPSAERPVVGGVRHATVKPLALMRLLVQLITPPGGVVLEPFAGSGTTIEAAMLLGVRSIGVELLEEHHELIQSRIQRALDVMERGHHHVS